MTTNLKRQLLQRTGLSQVKPYSHDDKRKLRKTNIDSSSLTGHHFPVKVVLKTRDETLVQF